jgi:nucleotide-binding universal stress UspA family protein
MFSNILLAVDGSDLSLRAARHGIELAAAVNARVIVVSVTIPWAAYFSREPAAVVPDAIVPEIAYEARREAIAARTLQGVVAEAERVGVAAKAVHRTERDPYRAIIDVAQRERCDLIVMGSHGHRGITGALLGSETMKVLAHAEVPVLVHRG